MMAENYQDVAAAEDIAAGTFATFELAETAVVVCNVKGEFYAVENRCSHALATFDEGRLRGFRLMCPRHGASFDVRDGCVKGAPATQSIGSYPCRVVDGRIQVAVD